jgi:hypothetical protein
MKCFLLNRIGILEQLKCEELLLRASQLNYFIFNFNPNALDTNIVLGFSGKANELINISNVNSFNRSIEVSTKT